MAGLKVEICLKKNPPRAQIFRYFRYESRNNNKKNLKEANDSFPFLFMCNLFDTHAERPKILLFCNKRADMRVIPKNIFATLQINLETMQKIGDLDGGHARCFIDESNLVQGHENAGIEKTIKLLQTYILLKVLQSKAQLLQ